MQSVTDNTPYFDFHTKDGSGISFEHWMDSRSVMLHAHSFYEVVLIERGPCSHIYQGMHTLLIPGDAVVVPPHHAHGFSLSGASSIFLCQFSKRAIQADLLNLLSGRKSEKTVIKTGEQVGIAYRTDEAPDAVKMEALWEHLLADKEDYYRDSEIETGEYLPNRSKQGTIHLNPRELTFVASLFNSMFEAPSPDESFNMLKKKAFAEVILLELHQALQRQKLVYKVHSGGKQAAISDVLVYMEENMTEALDFDLLAEKYGFSTNHFRKIFLDTTGLSPVKYMNRLRIARACEYMQHEHRSAREAAELVGFVDMNYFSRTFKQFMGCPPGMLSGSAAR